MGTVDSILLNSAKTVVSGLLLDMAGTGLGLVGLNNTMRACVLVDRDASQDAWIFGCNFPTIMPT